MKQKIIVTGHKGPDTDSVCSALAYAFYKNRTDTSNVYIAVRGGEINDETRFVLDRFGFRVPPLIRSLMPQVQEIPRKRLITVSPSMCMGEAAHLMRKNRIHSLPVIDDASVVRGVVDAVDIASVYAAQLEDGDVLLEGVEFDTLVRRLEARVLRPAPPAFHVTGKLVLSAGFSHDALDGDREASVVIVQGEHCNNLPERYPKAETLLFCGSMSSDEAVTAWPRHVTAVLRTAMTATQVLQVLRSSIAVSAFMQGTVPLLSMTDTLERAKKAVLDSSARCAVVVDGARQPVNIVTRSDLIRFTRKKVVLVDHNETAQAVDGVEEADILEIIDHHRVGDISTFRPIYFCNEPVGSTCTIVAELYAENGVFLPKPMAGLLLSGILSDTMNLNLSTTTPKDVRTVRRLSAAVGVDVKEYGLELLQSGSVMFRGLPAADVLMKDFKEYVLFDTHIGVSQAVVFSFDGVRRREAEFKTAMNDLRKRIGLAAMVFLATDPLDKKSYLVVSGSAEAFEEAFGVHIEDGHAILDGILSRKKDFIPPVADVLSRYA